MNETERRIANIISNYGLNSIQKLEVVGSNQICAASQAVQSGNKSEYDLYVNAYWATRSQIKAIEWMYNPENKKFCDMVAKIASELV